MDVERHRQRIERVLDHVARNLDRELTLAELAKLAHLSEFHFHRIFAAAVGEPLGRYVTRRRLEVAALRLAYEPARSVTDIALASGYSSISNFSKAFRAYFGVSPSALRTRGPEPLPAAIGTLTRTHGRGFDPRDLHVLPPDDTGREQALAELLAALRFESFAGLEVACLASPAGYDAAALVATWTELITRVRALGWAEGPIDAWGIPHDSPTITAPELCRYHACVPCPAAARPAPPLFRARIPAGRYAVFAYAGAQAGIERMVRAIYSVWLPASGVELDEFAPLDRYVGDWPVDGVVALEIWIKLADRK